MLERAQLGPHHSVLESKINKAISKKVKVVKGLGVEGFRAVDALGVSSAGAPAVAGASVPRVAEVHVHVATAKPRVHPARSTIRWADRAALGFVMAVAAYVIERAVVRGTKKANAESAAKR
jgi:hypothetical protein